MRSVVHSSKRATTRSQIRPNGFSKRTRPRRSAAISAGDSCTTSLRRDLSDTRGSRIACRLRQKGRPPGAAPTGQMLPSPPRARRPGLVGGVGPTALAHLRPFEELRANGGEAPRLDELFLERLVVGEAPVQLLLDQRPFLGAVYLFLVVRAVAIPVVDANGD